MKTKYLWLSRAFFAYLIWVIAFFGIKRLLWIFHIEYRQWLEMAGQVIIVLTPFVLFGRLLSLNAARSGIMVAYVLFSGLVIFFAGISWLLSMNTESTNKDGQFVVAYGSSGKRIYYSYEKISFFGRRITYGREQAAMLTEKYGAEFTLNWERSHLGIGHIRYTSETYPGLFVRVYGKDGVFTDDLVESYFWGTFFDASRECSPETVSDILGIWLISKKDNIDLLAEEAAILVTHALKKMDDDDNAPCDAGVLNIMVRDEEHIRISLPFGNSPELEEEGKERDHYTYPEHIYEKIMEMVTREQ